LELAGAQQTCREDGKSQAQALVRRRSRTGGIIDPRDT